jgi:hypothetical protein
MKLHLKKLSQSGFSHFELLVIIGVTVVVAAVGTFVYSKVHKSHAGGYNYTYVGSAIAKTNPIDFYACKQLNAAGQTFTYNFFAQNFSSKINPTVTYTEMAVGTNNLFNKVISSHSSNVWVHNAVSYAPVSQYVSVGDKNNPSYVSNVSYASYGKGSTLYSTQGYKVIVALNDQIKITLNVNGEIYIPQSIFSSRNQPAYVAASYVSNCTN